ncbi:MAG: hypothetical protein WBD38_12420 [Candidatus Dormiibacterota bacterium]
MTLQLEVVGPCLVLLLGGLMMLVRPVGVIFVIAEALALFLLVRLWQFSGAGSLVLPIYEPLPSIQLVIRVDHLGVFFASLGIAAGLLVSLPWLVGPLRRHRPHQGWVLFAQAGMILVALAGGLETLAAGWAMTATALCVLVLVGRLDSSGRLVAGSTALWHMGLQFAGALALLAAAVTVEVAAGTGGFDAVPVGAIDSRAVLFAATAPVLALLGMGATARALKDPIGTALAVTSVSVPMACYLLVRLYDLGDGRLPDPRLGTAMAVIGGTACFWFAISSLWAVDLGATLTRLVQAAAALLLVAAGAGSGLGVAAVAIGAISVCLGASLAYAIVDAGQGRLPSLAPGRGRLRALSATTLSVVVLLALAWSGGVGGGLASSTRIATIQAGLGAGGIAALATIPALVGSAIMLYAGYGAGRFGGGAAPSRTDVVRLLLIGLALPATSIAAITLVYPIVVPLAASVLRITSAEVSIALHTSPAGSIVLIALFAVLTLAASVLARPGGPFDSRRGLPRAPWYLPPPLAVAPLVYSARFYERLVGPAAGLAGMVRRHPLLVTTLLVAAALSALNSVLR